jgi:hypothetical protein
VVERKLRHIDPKNHVPLAQSQKHVPVAIKGNRARAIERRSANRCAIGSRRLFAGAGKGFDRARRQIHTAHAMIPDIGDKQKPFPVESNTVGLAKLRLLRRAAIA